MNNHSDAIYIRQCTDLIEARWQRGPSGEWKSYDFEKLSGEIFDVTGVSLSLSTLKRLFGKVSYHNLPSVYTLNTLARFAGFEDWNAFKRRESIGVAQGANSVETGSPATTQIAIPPAEPITNKFRNLRLPKKNIFWWPLISLPIAALAYFFVSSTKPPRRGPVNPSSFSLSSNKVLTEGVPNSVVFHYDASAASSDDSVFIVQDWDMSRRTLVSRNGHAHSAIYYYPGFFNAKLVVDTQIVQTHGLMIGSGGWLAMAEGDPLPFYFKKEEYLRKEGSVVVDSSLFTRNHLPLYPRSPWISICYIKDMGPLPDDHFIFETTLRCDRVSSTEACQRVEIFIHCKNDAFIIPLCAPACIGDLNLCVPGKEIKSKEADLSGFGTDLNQWTTFKIETVNRHMQFIINNRPVYTLDFPNPPADIVGVQYRFRGGGSVKDTRFISQGKTIELR
jgi:hypothetical protein